MSEQITITVPKALAQQFLEMSEGFSDSLSNAGCNDWMMEDTPENREVIELAEADNLSMTLEEYRASDHYEEPRVMGEGTWKGKLICFDSSIFDSFVKRVKEATGE